jgi:hypothetical protein
MSAMPRHLLAVLASHAPRRGISPCGLRKLAKTWPPLIAGDGISWPHGVCSPVLPQAGDLLALLREGYPLQCVDTAWPPAGDEGSAVIYKEFAAKPQPIRWSVLGKTCIDMSSCSSWVGHL